ncbi:MAG: alpha-hydroxy-acid oxidizing protein [Alphaproteobacteria bacterium TMED89]|nr:alpha-hydroxy-acid oxidizing enzyme [Rhodospirillaceae bacterium]RPH13308.1 MAG: alpha-hydroxy-acid oxidizing protein [Alphaproteobacteria bacterium TMED89]
MFAGPIRDAEDARRRARRVLPRLVFDYIDGAAGQEQGEAHNRALLRETRLQPRILQDVRDRRLSTKLFGQDFDLPVGIAPMGMCNLAWPGADLMLARLAAREGVPHGLSTVASTSMERVWSASEGRAWFQLYFSGAGDGTVKLVERAREVGYQTLVLTVDVPEVGRRPRELKQGFKMPFRMGPRTFTDFALHPRWSLTSLLRGAPSLGNFGPKDQARGFVFHRTESRAGADWTFFDRLRDMWPGALVVKGVLDPRDAAELQQRGADGIQVSSHGGRQLDGGVSPVEALPKIRAAVGAAFPVLYDSGLRSGEDVLKVLALGADFAFLGRPLQFAIAARQEQGLTEYWDSVKTELSIALAMTGLTDIAQASPAILSG